MLKFFETSTGNLLAAEERDTEAVAAVAERYGLAIDFGAAPRLLGAPGLRPPRACCPPAAGWGS